MTGKGGDELNTGIVTSAASGTIPDIYMGTTSQGALFTSINAMANVYDRWMAMPEAYRSQFNPDMITEVTPEDRHHVRHAFHRICDLPVSQPDRLESRWN